ncbi:MULTISPECIES: OB-fold nucleic acid binding domain-containing protein [Halobacterium]|uniref:OB-fold nucleic acid binding domain-containing protein n=1 Tax=Halobacterium TaxID=2239 RepID=UPI0019655B1E|nr:MULTISPECIES: OB-fold nucleic acid binding domain-containing protein [Halobacterium]MDL0121664.1 OB-fold nucleic acid binding domain-containing protein [Halobacterium salinarum]QRY23952.1 S1 RNA-binding domain-containing protein [Halobacterium sp. BOL4-2]
MGTCIVCGSSTDGHICATHEEDVVFDFRGDSPDQLTPGRFYRGTVDGFAEFGVFVDVGGTVTGLLHRSEVPGRVDSLAWDVGDDVFVQVTDVHDNGNIDLGWSIRESMRDFRGELVHDPANDSDAALPADDEADSDTTDDGDTTDDSRDAETADGGKRVSDADATTERAADASFEFSGADADDDTDHETVRVDALDDHVDDAVTVEGEITAARQTSGPTVFELTDETGAVDAAAFVEAGVRAYPEIEPGAVVQLTGTVERRRGDLQVETEAVTELTGDRADEVRNRMDAALDDRAAPATTALLAPDDDAVAAVHDDIVDAATAVRRAVIDARPVIVRHPTTVEGYVAGTAIERALLPLIRDEHAREDAEYHYVDRRPLDDAFYTIDDATGDVTSMLEAAHRHDEKHPLFVFVGTGSTTESTDALDLLDIYDADTVVVDGGYADDAAGMDVLVSPTAAGEQPVNTGALGAQLAAVINDDVREDLAHLPAVAYWTDLPAAYADLAADASYDSDAREALRDAVALEAFYQSYEDKRELIADLLWGDADDDLADHIATQFRDRLATELSTAEPHLSTRHHDGVAFETLDVGAYTHQYDFPPVDLLLDALHRRADSTDVLLGAGEDALRVRSDDAVDVHAVVDAIDDDLTTTAGVTARGARDGRIEFLAGERDAVLDAVVGAIAAQLA